MSENFASGKRALAICDVCGQTFYLKELKNLTVKLKITATKACPACWTPDQPQWQTGILRGVDPQALRDPRPDQSLHLVRAILVVINNGVGGSTYLGKVAVTTS